MFELLNEVKPTHVMHLPQNNLDQKGYPFWADEVRKLKAKIEDFYGITISNSDLRKAIVDCNQERQHLINFFELSALDPTPISGLEQFNVKEAFGFQYDIQKKNDELVKRTQELKAYWEKELKGTIDSRPRILITGCPLGGVKEKILAKIEELGAVIVGYDSCSGIRTQMEMVDENPARDPIESIAEKYLKTNCSVMSPNPGRFRDLDYLIEHYRADAVIECTLVACHTFNLESHSIGKYVEQKGLPYMHLESDYSQADAAQFATRIEAFLEIVRARKGEIVRR